MRVTFKAGLIFLLAVLVRSSESRTVDKRAVERRSATCSANSRTYNDGDTITYHTVTSPIDNARCTKCECSAGSIIDCKSHFCDLGVPSEVCDNWKTREEGICCPRCSVCEPGAKAQWAKHVSSGKCYECSCNADQSVSCSQVWCPSCPGKTIDVAGKCCPICIPTTITEAPFTIQLTTTRPPPVFPFPFGKKRDVTPRDEQFEGEEYGRVEQ